MPHNCLGSTPVFECLKRKIPVYAVEENKTVLDVTKQKIFPKADGIILVNSYRDLTREDGPELTGFYKLFLMKQHHVFVFEDIETARERS